MSEQRVKYLDKKTCRLCGSNKLEQVIELTPTPLANAFVPAERRTQTQDVFPLALRKCGTCHHLQLGCVVDPEVLFRDYVYVSGTSSVFREHFNAYAQDMVTRAQLSSGDLVFEIGSNDGTLLGCFKKLGMNVLGIDPAVNIARDATRSGIETIGEFFTPDTARRIRDERGPARVITANNVCAHIDDLSAVVEGVKILLAPDGLFAFEVSYLVDVLNDVLFDTIYHEHLDYHAVGPLIGFFERHDMRVVGATRVPSHGGSIRIYAGHRTDSRVPDRTLDDILALEKEMKLDRAATYQAFSRRIDSLGREVSKTVRALKAKGHSIAGYGAPAKATTLLYHFQLCDALDFIVDDSPLKQGLFTPGYHLPVLPSAQLLERHPDYTLLLAWNFADAIIAKSVAYSSAGGHFIVPVPHLRVT
jgi:hypothetical protein